MTSAGDSSEEPLDLESATKLIARLERRLKRERAAREEAEEIADRGMRELWLANRELDRRVDERTADLEATLAELEVASTVRERFLSTLSHEMRTPLNGVLGMLELLDPYTTGDQARTYLDTARTSADGLDNLVRRLLDLVELHTGSLRAEVQIVSPNDLRAKIEHHWQRPALQKGHLLSVVSFFQHQQLHVDPNRVHQIVNELLQNAVTHANPGRIEVRLLPANSNLAIEVVDSGPGINDEQLHKLFDDFTATNTAAERSTQGLGLGLALSRQIAEALGGTLTISSADDDDLGVGTIARLTVPAEITSATAA